MIDNSINRELKLNEELRSSIRLLELELSELQNIEGANDFFHLPLQLLASGIEGLLKCTFCYGFYEINN